jgi:ABC-2 type transport system ATP-binding protein
LEEAEQLSDRIGMLDCGKLIRIGTLEQLQKSVTYNYSIKILSNQALSLPELEKGEVVSGTDGNIRVLTAEDEAFRISRELTKAGYKFTINPVSLDDIFFYLAKRKIGD